MKNLVSQVKRTVIFCGFEVESITPDKLFISLDIKSKSRFRKKSYCLALSKSLNGILTAERQLSRNAKRQILIFDPVNNLPEPTLEKIKLFHDLDHLQEYLTNK